MKFLRLFMVAKYVRRLLLVLVLERAFQVIEKTYLLGTKGCGILFIVEGGPENLKTEPP